MTNRTPPAAHVHRLCRVVLGVCAVLPVLAFGLMIWWDHAREMRLAKTRALAGVYVMAEHADAAFLAVELALQLVDTEIASRPLPDLRSDPVLHTFLADLPRRFPPLESVLLVDADGYVVATSRVFPAPAFDVKAREYYLVGKSGHEGLHFSLPFRGPFSRSVSFTASRPFARAGAFQGILAATIFPDYFRALYRNAPFSGPNSSTALMRLDGTVIFRSPDARVPLETAFSHPGLLQAVKARESGIVADFTLPDGSRGIAVFRVLPSAGLILVHAVSASDILDAWYQRMFGYALAALAVSAGCVILLILAWREGRVPRRSVVGAGSWPSAPSAGFSGAQVLRTDGAPAVPSSLARGASTILSLVFKTLALVRGRAPDGVWPELNEALEGATYGVGVAQRLVADAAAGGAAVRTVNMGVALEDVRRLLLGSVWPRLFVSSPADRDTLDICVDPEQLDVALVDMVLGLIEMNPSGIRLTAAPELADVTGATGAPVPAGPYVCVTLRLAGESGAARPARESEDTRLRFARAFAEACGGMLVVDVPEPRTVTATLWLPSAHAAPDRRGP